jgi:hypothetical protein
MIKGNLSKCIWKDSIEGKTELKQTVAFKGNSGIEKSTFGDVIKSNVASDKLD